MPMPKLTMRHVAALAGDPRLADRHGEVVELGHLEAPPVEDLVLEEDHRVRVADRRLEQALGVRRRVGLHHLQPRDLRVHRREVVAVLRRHPRRGAVRAAEHDRRAHLAAGHVEGLRRRVDDLVDRLQREVEGHELDDRPQAGEGGADREAGEAVLGDRRVDDAPRPELVEQALADLVGALVLADLLADQEDVAVAAHLLGHRVAQRLAHRLVAERRPLGNLRRGRGRGGGLRRDRLRRSLLRCRRRGGLLRRRRGGLRRLGRRLLTLLDEHRDRRIDPHALGALADEELPDRPLVDGLELHRRLVGLDLGDHLAGGDAVALLDQPFRQRALLHGRRQRGHQYLGCHASRPLRRRRRSRARPRPAPGSPARTSPPR